MIFGTSRKCEFRIRLPDFTRLSGAGDEGEDGGKSNAAKNPGNPDFHAGSWRQLAISIALRSFRRQRSLHRLPAR